MKLIFDLMLVTAGSIVVRAELTVHSIVARAVVEDIETGNFGWNLVIFEYRRRPFESSLTHL